MAHLIAVLVFVFVTNYAATDAIALDCLFGIKLFAEVDSVYYTCIARPLIDQNDTVNAVYGAHPTGKGHLDVEAIDISSQNLPCFPRNMEQFFPNLLVIYLANNSITTITNSRLLPFPNLRYLSLHSNKLSTLDVNLFSGMWTSSTSYYIDFRSNTCIDERATTSDQLFMMKLNLLRNCSAKISPIGGSQDLTELENKNTELEKRNTELETRNTELKNRNTELETNSSQLENSSNNWKQLETIVAFLQAVIENKISLKIEPATSEN